MTMKQLIFCKVHDHYALCYKILQYLLKKLSNNSHVLKLYSDAIEEQLDSGVIEKVNDPDKSAVVHYMPHHCVIREHKTTTKLRIVNDCSAKRSARDPSLNKMSLCGSKINPSCLTFAT